VSSLAIAGMVFTCIFAGAVLGMVLQTILPEHHLSPDSKDVVKVGMGLIATMAALVLGLLTGSTKSAFDAQDSEVKQSAANLILLDRMLAHYGPETKGARDLLRSTVAQRLAVTWPETGAPPVAGEVPGLTPAAERIVNEIRALTPQNDSQRWFQSQALQISVNVMPDTASTPTSADRTALL
jgi:type II secretory pathway pseudopilin PulG